jgi:type VI protein secretion system component VasK
MDFGSIGKGLLGGGLAMTTGGLSLGLMGDKGRSFAGNLPFVGGFSKALLGDPAEEAHQKAMQKVAAAAAQRRPEMMQSRMNAMGQMSQAFEPMNRMTAEMNGMGPDARMMDIQSMTQNPMSQGMQDQMYQSAFGTNAPTNSSLSPEFAPGQGKRNVSPFRIPGR